MSSWRVKYCLYGIRCIRTSLVTAIAVISVALVYNTLSLHPRRPTSQLLIFDKFHDRDQGNIHHDRISNSYNFGNTTSTKHKSTKHIKLRAKYKKKKPAKANTPVIQSAPSLLYGEINGNTEKMILWHMIPRYRKHGPERISKCGTHRCVITSNRSRIAVADAIIVDIFLLSRNRVKDKPVRTSPNQAWIFFTKEPWTNYDVLFPKENWDSIFNWTMTYQKDSEFVTSYGEVIPDIRETKHDWDKIMKMKTKSVFWLVSNCDAGSRRHVYVEQLMKHIDVDIVGKCGRRTCTENGTKGDTDFCYQQSRFYLAFESRHCQDYVTEKFFRTFNHHIIPVVRGKANYSSLCPSDLYVNTADFESPKKLAAYLHYLERNTTAYLGYLKRRAKYQMISGGMRECEICTHLHHLDKYRKSYSSISDWIDRCETPSQPHLH